MNAKQVRMVKGRRVLVDVPLIPVTASTPTSSARHFAAEKVGVRAEDQAVVDRITRTMLRPLGGVR